MTPPCSKCIPKLPARIFFGSKICSRCSGRNQSPTLGPGQLLEKHVTEQMVAEVAAEHAKGRRLIIGTTQLDAQRLVLWDMGAIASSGDPEAVKLFRKIMLTSASVPGAFPPQYIRVEAGGGWYEEMHVDGGTTAEVVLYETALKPFAELRG